MGGYGGTACRSPRAFLASCSASVIVLAHSQERIESSMESVPIPEISGGTNRDRITNLETPHHGGITL